MNISYGASIFYFIAVAALVLGVYLVQKSEQKLYGSVWVPISIIAVTCYQVLIGAILNLIHIPVNIISIGIFNLILAMFLWYLIIRKQYRQKYRYEVIDGVYLVVLLVVVGAFALQRYGIDLHIHYLTIDPAAHLKSAMDVVRKQQVDTMFYASLNNALLIEMLGVTASSVGYYYKIFVLADVMHLFLAGLMFFGVIRRYCQDNFLKIAGVVLSIVYLLGYPLNSTIFGFVYLGMGVTLIAYLFTLTDEFIRGNLHKWTNIILLSLGCLGIFQAYVLFMPVTFFAILTCILVKQFQHKKLFSVDTVVTGLAIFLIPCVIGLVYTYLGIFGGDTSVGSAIAGEGAIYRDLYSNFVWLAPLALYGCWGQIKERKNRLGLYLLPFLMGFILMLFARGMQHTVSSYYYFKNYYLLWMVVFVLAFIGISYVEKKTRFLIVSGFAVWSFTMFLMVFNIENGIHEKSELYCSWSKAGTYNDVYSFNKETLGLPFYQLEKIQLYQHAITECLDKGEELVPLAGYWEDCYWMEGITNQRLNGFDYWNYDDETFFENLEKRANYVMVLTDNDFYKNHAEYFDSLERIYENDLGYIAKVK